MADESSPTLGSTSRAHELLQASSSHAAAHGGVREHWYWRSHTIAAESAGTLCRLPPPTQTPLQLQKSCHCPFPSIKQPLRLVEGWYLVGWSPGAGEYDPPRDWSSLREGKAGEQSSITGGAFEPGSWIHGGEMAERTAQTQTLCMHILPLPACHRKQAEIVAKLGEPSPQVEGE